MTPNEKMQKIVENLDSEQKLLIAHIIKACDRLKEIAAEQELLKAAKG